ncbi:MAG: hypothetical protein ACYTGP_11680 [Planctomycetota bacterium]|jgi:hypothetical protein
MTRLGVLVIHGMGSQEEDFAQPLVDEVSDRLGAIRDRVVWQDVWWAPALKEREDHLWVWMNTAFEPGGDPVRLDWEAARKFVIHNFGDAIAYHKDSTPGAGMTAAALVHGIISDRVRELKDELADAAAPIVVVAHSLGGHMMSNYLWDRQRANDAEGLEPIPTFAGMVTFGCNIPLFSLSYPTAEPIRLPGDGIAAGSNLDAASRWLNFLDADDALGWPVKPVYAKNLDRLNDAQKKTVEKIEDFEISVGSLLTGWNALAHNKYWTDNDFTKPLAAFLERLLGALDADS